MLSFKIFPYLPIFNKFFTIRKNRENTIEQQKKDFTNTMSGRKSFEKTTNSKRFGAKVGGYKVTLCEETGTKGNGYEGNGYEKNGYERYLCQLCGFVLRNPIQTMRGQLACYSCYDNALR